MFEQELLRRISLSNVCEISDCIIFSLEKTMSCKDCFTVLLVVFSYVLKIFSVSGMCARSWGKSTLENISSLTFLILGIRVGSIVAVS